MHDAMQDEVTHALFLATFIAVLLDGKGMASMSTPYCLFSRGLALGACVRCSLGWWMWLVVMRMRLQHS